MADFKIRKVDANVVQNADYIHNQGSIGQLQVTPRVKVQLQDLLADIAALAQSGAVSQEISYELRDSILAVAEEADTSAPRPHRLAAALSHAKEIAAGLSSTVGIAEAVDSIIKALGGGA